MSTFAIASFSFCICICSVLPRLVFLCFMSIDFAIASFSFRNCTASRKRGRYPCLVSLSLQSSAQCRVNSCVKMKLPKPDPRRLPWPRQEPRQGSSRKLWTFYNRSVTARRGHKKRLAPPGYPNLRAILAWDQALQSATRGLGLAAFQVQKPVLVEQNQKRVFIAMEDLPRALQKRANGRKKRASLLTTLPCGTSELHFEVDWPRDTRPPRLWEHRHAVWLLLEYPFKYSHGSIIKKFKSKDDTLAWHVDMALGNWTRVLLRATSGLANRQLFVQAGPRDGHLHPRPSSASTMKHLAKSRGQWSTCGRTTSQARFAPTGATQTHCR